MTHLRLFQPLSVFLAAGIALSLGASTTHAQLTWNITYQDTTIGFADPTFGATRQNTILQVTNYLSSIIDSRGSVNLLMQPSTALSGNTLGQAGGGFSFFTTPLQTGFIGNEPFKNATTGSASSPNGDARFDFTTPSKIWNNGTAAPASDENDLFSIALHEFTHFLGFSYGNNGTGMGFQGQPLGDVDLYSNFAKYVQVGNLTGNRLINNSAQFVGTVADLNGNNLYFSGPMATAANLGNNVELNGRSHVEKLPTDPSVMKPLILTGTTARVLQGYEIGVLLDIGYNNFNWNNTTGLWSESTTVDTVDVSKWRNVDGDNALAPVGSITHNLILRFGGSGVGSYTSTNDLPANPFLINRLILESTSTNATGNTIQGSKLEFGFDNGFNVTPQIEQNGSGRFIINTPIGIPNNLISTGGGAGRVTLGGVVDGAGSITKSGTSTFVLAGNNTYGGTTTVQAGTLLVNNTAGSGTSSGAVTVQTGATIGGTGRINGTLTVNNGATLAPGDGGTTVGRLTLAGTATLGTTGVDVSFAINLNGITSGTLHDQITLLTGATLNLTDVSLNATIGGGYTPLLTHRLFIIDNQNGSGGVNGTFNGLANGQQFSIGGTPAFIYYTGDVTSQSLTGGNDVVISFSPVPEPTHGVLIAAGGLLLYFTWRRRAIGFTPTLV